MRILDLSALFLFFFLYNGDDDGDNNYYYLMADAAAANNGRISSVRRDRTTYCRETPRRLNHMNSLWDVDFPYYNGNVKQQPSAVCEGTVTEKNINNNKEICISGRVTYQQIEQALGGGRPIWQPAAKTISINGHLICGSANIVFGADVKYLYDFVTSYTVNGIEYKANETNIMDHVLVASRGTIDGVCLNASLFAPSSSEDKEEEWYQISHETFKLEDVNLSKLTAEHDDIGLIFFNTPACVVEFHTPNVPEPGFVTKWASRARMNLVNGLVYAFPAFLYGAVPAFAATGISRKLAKGVYSTKEYTNPFIAPDNLGQVDAVQIDCTRDTLVQAVDNEGLFTTRTNKVPLYFNVVIKRIIATGTNYNCWSTTNSTTITMASIDLEAPAGQGAKLDEFIETIVFPALKKHGDVSLHFGKRIPPESSLLQSALDLYESCGVQVNLNATVVPDNQCYHPICGRSVTQRLFRYPEQYYA